jgi:hypothetical protein
VSEHTANEAGRSRRLLLGASLGVALAAAGGLLVFVSGEDAASVDATRATLAAAASDEEVGLDAELDTELTLEALPTVTYDVFLDRDPFEPVLEEAGSGGDAETPDGGAEPEAPALGAGLPAGSIVIDPTTGQATVVQAVSDLDPPPSTDPTAPPAPSTPSGCRGSDEVVCDGRVLSLLGVAVEDGQEVVTFQVDDVAYEVTQGEVFATSFRLLSVDGSCATVQYGDDSVRLCEGQRVLK